MFGASKVSQITAVYTGVDLSKIFGGKTRILGKVGKGDKCMGVSQLLGDTCPGFPPKSTPMAVYTWGFNPYFSIVSQGQSQGQRISVHI